MTNQPLAIDRGGAALYIAAAIALLGGCARSPAALAPTDLEVLPPERVAEWVRATLPPSPVRYDVKWKFHQEGSSVGGRGAVRLAPPDSVRLDLEGPLGLGASSAVIIGREVRWAEPERNFRDLLHTLPLLWAAVGIAIPPEPGATVAGRDGPGGNLWRYVTGADTLVFLSAAASDTAEARFESELREGGRLVGRASVGRNGANGLARTAELTLPPLRARLELEFVDAVHEAFPPDIWTRRR